MVVIWIIAAFFLFAGLISLVGRLVAWPGHAVVRSPSAHELCLKRIDELEYELGVGPGGQRKLDAEMAEIERATRRLALGSTDIRDWATAKGIDLTAHEMAALAQTNPEEYWRRVAWDIWRRAGHPAAPPRV